MGRTAVTEADKTDRPAHDPQDAKPAEPVGKARKGGARTKTAAAPGTVVPSVPVAESDVAPEGPAPVPMSGSTLIGDGSDGAPPAAPKPRDETALSSEVAGREEPMADPVAVPPSEPAPRPTPAQTTRPRGGFMPMVLGGAMAAGLGAAAAMWAGPQMKEPFPAVAPDLPRDEIAAIAREEAARAAQAALADSAGSVRAQVEEAARAAVEARLAEVPAPPVVGAVPPPPIDMGTSPQPAVDPQAITTLEARLAEQAELIEDQRRQLAEQADAFEAQAGRLEEQAAQIEELAARPTLDPEDVDRVQSLTDRAEALEDQITATAEDAQAAITAAQSDAEQLRLAAEEATRRAEAVAAVAAIQNALDQGVSAEGAVSRLEQAGIRAPEALRGEVPTLPALQQSYDGAARAALKAALRVEQPRDGAVGVIGNFLRAQTGARSVAPRDGADADAILSRAGAAVAAGDIDTAVTEIAALPEAARAIPEMATWLSQAEAYRAARGAVQALSAAQTAPTTPEGTTDAVPPPPIMEGAPAPAAAPTN